MSFRPSLNPALWLIDCSFELLHDCRLRVLSAYALVVVAVAAWYGMEWQAWNTTPWDSSSYLIFPSVFLAMGVDVSIVISGFFDTSC